MRAGELTRLAAQKYWNAEDAQVVVEGWRQSGQSLKAFARSHAIQAHRIARWARQLQETAVRERPPFHPVRVVEALPQDVAGEGRIEVVLSGGLTIRLPRGFAAAELRQVLDVLEGRASC